MYGYNFSCFNYTPSAKAIAFQKAQATKAKNLAAKRAAWLAADENRIELVAQINVAKGDFIASMRESIAKFGSLTEKQEAAVRASFAKKAEFAAAKIVENAAIAAVSNFVGTVGDRDVFVLTCTFSKDFDGMNGFYTAHRFADEAGNVFKYNGNKIASEGDKITIKATIKAHTEWNGVKTTQVNRPKAI